MAQCGTDTSKQAQLMEVLKKEVRAILIPAKEGLTPVQLEKQYMAMVCKPLPVQDLGFRSTLDLVKHMPEVVRVFSLQNGTFILKAIADNTTKGIARLVANQKRKSRTKAWKRTATKANDASPSTNSENPQHSPLNAKTPVLPATLKAELQDLLSSSPLLLKDFDQAFLRHFGRTFQYTQYGFSSLLEALRSVSDVIEVKQTKSGFLLVLRKYLANEIKQEEMLKVEAQEEEVPQDEAQEEEVPQDEAQEEEVPQDEAQEEEVPQDEAQEEEVPQDEAQEEEVPQDEAQEEEVPQDEAQEEEVPQDEAQEEEELQDEAQEEEVTKAASAAEMHPLEPICETDSFHQAAVLMNWEPVDTQAVDLGDHFEEPQDFQEFLLHKLTLTPEIPPDAVQDRSLCSLPPLKRRCLVGVVVEFIVSPSQFYIHICSEEPSYKLQDLMFDMRHLYSYKIASDKYVMPESAVQPGQLCCVMVSRWWYRVIIHRVINDQEVEVFFADYGNLQIVQKSWLRFLKWCFLKLPAQAIPCSLAWVKPVEGSWSPAATEIFKSLCRFKELVGVVDEYVDGVLHLFLCDTSTKEDVYFHSVLREMGFADVCGENIPSQEFKELNPFALYVQPCGKQGNAELVEQESGLQKESLDADSGTLQP